MNKRQVLDIIWKEEYLSELLFCSKKKSNSAPINLAMLYRKLGIEKVFLHDKEQGVLLKILQY